MKPAGAPAVLVPAPKAHPYFMKEEASILRQQPDSYFRLLPPELVAKVHSYVEWEVRRDTRSAGDFRLKTSIVGNPKVGKTAIARRYIEDSFTPDFQWDTIQMTAFKLRNIVHENYFVKHWIADLGFQQRFRTLSDESHIFTRPPAHCVVVVYDITDASSFNDCGAWVREVERYCDDSCVRVLCGSKADLADLRVITIEEGSVFAKNHNMSFLEVSAKQNSNIDELFRLCLREIFKTKSPTEIYNQQHPPENHQHRAAKEAGCAVS